MTRYESTSEIMGVGPMKKLLPVAVTLVALAVGPAVAADLGRKAPAYIPPPAPPPPTFTGFYKGVIEMGSGIDPTGVEKTMPLRLI